MHSLGYRRLLLWGRSMGATTALLFAQRYHPPYLAALALDSPYSSIRRVALHMLQQQLTLPSFLADLLLKLYFHEVEKVTGLKIDTLDLLPELATLTLPILYLASKADRIVPFDMVL